MAEPRRSLTLLAFLFEGAIILQTLAVLVVSLNGAFSPAGWSPYAVLLAGFMMAMFFLSFCLIDMMRGKEAWISHKKVWNFSVALAVCYVTLLPFILGKAHERDNNLNYHAISRQEYDKQIYILFFLIVIFGVVTLRELYLEKNIDRKPKPRL